MKHFDIFGTMEPLKTLTLRNLEPYSDNITKLKDRFNCASAAQALLKAGSNYLAMEKELEDLKREVFQLRKKHSGLKDRVGDFFEAMQQLQKEL